MTDDDKPVGERAEVMDVGGVRLYVSVRPGSAEHPPLLLVNGLGANLEMLDPFVDAFAEVSAERTGTIRLDLPGIGGSPARLRPMRVSGLARLVDRLLVELGHEQADVLGVSWGGGLAQQFAYQHPHRCRRLVLVSTSTGAISIPGRPSALLQLASPLRYLRPSRLKDLGPLLYGREYQDNPEVARLHASLMRAPSLPGYYAQLYAVAGWTSLFWLHRVRQPTLILAGSDDPLVPACNAVLMARRLPNATLRVVNGGHLFLVAQARAMAPIVHRFLRAL
uniref:Poly(3-hydroxyalkanoate) depolymerase n=1 Tax=uncultured bacterium 20 TaxID=1748270 RepID=A0A0U3U853_9BACT|nr:poly(3-hydroxyalkanoate) depolymerase [uncultured bacterium 20]